MPIDVKYSAINKMRVEKAFLVDISDSDYQNFIKRLRDKSKLQRGIQRQKRLQFYQKHQSECDHFFSLYRFFNLENIKKTVSAPIPHLCKNCWYSKPDKYRAGQNALVCWYGKPYGARPRKIMASDVEPCQDGFDLSSDATILLDAKINGKQVTITGRGIRAARYCLEKGEIIKARLRLAWEASDLRLLKETPHVCNFSWLAAFIRDVEKLDTGYILSVGSKARRYEKEVKRELQQNGFELLKRLIKFYYVNQTEPHFKVMDAHVKYNNINYVIEVFTWRDPLEKALQVKDYCFLLRLAGINDPVPVLISDEEVAVWGFKNGDFCIVRKEEGKKVENVPIFSLNGFLRRVANVM